MLLELLDEEGRVLVTRDVNTVPGHCKARLAAGKTFAGVIYADSKKLRQTDQRGLIRRLGEVVRKHGTHGQHQVDPLWRIHAIPQPGYE